MLADRPTPLRLLLLFSRIGLTSFGGSLSGWLLRELVQERGWIGEEEFLNGLSLAQALPGVNVANLAIWFGYRLFGLRGALAGIAGIVLPPAILIVGLAAAFDALMRYPVTHQALAGAAAAAIGLSLTMGLTVARRVPRRVVPLLVLAATFVAIGLLHWPLLPVVIVAGTANVAIEWFRLARKAAA